VVRSWWWRWWWSSSSFFLAPRGGTGFLWTCVLYSTKYYSSYSINLPCIMCSGRLEKRTTGRRRETRCIGAARGTLLRAPQRRAPRRLENAILLSTIYSSTVFPAKERSRAPKLCIARAPVLVILCCFCGVVCRALELPPSANGLGNSHDSREFQKNPSEFPESRARGLGGCWRKSLERSVEKQRPRLTETNKPIVLFASPFHSTTA